ncbi:hypothetical protein ACOI38_17440 [Escherichia coli]|nr:hypothetical protein FOV95_18000 [Escherichia coli]
MKLTVDSVINEPRSVAITIDGYIPVDIKIIDSKKLPPLYWRGGDGKKTYLNWLYYQKMVFYHPSHW